jgi:trans-aconitate methyltransferase
VSNVWLDVPLRAYEAHMAAADVGQAQLLGELLATAMILHRPRSLAVLGCAGGNGFERVPADIERVVGVDLNPAFIAAARARFAGCLPQLELYVADVTAGLSYEPVMLAFAGLLLEYVDVVQALRSIQDRLAPTGALVTVVQLPGAAPVVTPTPQARLLAPLAAAFHHVAPHALTDAARRCGMRQTSSTMACASGGKTFQVQTFRNLAAADSESELA